MLSSFVNRPLWLAARYVCCLAAPASVCAAQPSEAPYPSRPIRFIVPQPPAENKGDAVPDFLRIFHPAG
jgi:hypothetical protein